MPVVAWLILQQRWEAACWLFLAAAVSDGIDGLLARWLNQMTQLGAALDTVADKALGVVTLVLLTQAGAIPLWVTLAILLRDSIIVLGALSYRGLAGHLEIHPTWLGKTHMFAEFALLALVLGGLAGVLELDGWLQPVVRDRIQHCRRVRRAVCVDMGRQGAPRARSCAFKASLTRPLQVRNMRHFLCVTRRIDLVEARCDTAVRPDDEGVAAGEFHQPRFSRLS